MTSNEQTTLQIPGSSSLPPHPTLGRYYANDSTRQHFVSALFDSTASHYERVERILSFGSGAWYRRKAMEAAGLRKGMKVLDLATGTGGVARGAESIVGPAGRVVALDASLGMLREWRGLSGSRRIQGLGDRLPVAGRSFDFVTVGYALRHFGDLQATFEELHRILRPQGTLLILEITPPRRGIAHQMLRLYMKHLIPFVTRVATRSHDVGTLMKYYWDTTDACLAPAGILSALDGAGFASAERKVTFGIFSDYVARKL